MIITKVTVAVILSAIYASENYCGLEDVLQTNPRSIS